MELYRFLLAEHFYFDWLKIDNRKWYGKFILTEPSTGEPNTEIHLLGWILFSHYPQFTLHSRYIMDVKMNYNKVASGMPALISSLLI